MSAVKVNGVHHAAMAQVFESIGSPVGQKCRVPGCANGASHMNLLCEDDFQRFALSGEWPRFYASDGHRAVVALTDWLTRTELERRNGAR